MGWVVSGWLIDYVEEGGVKEHVHGICVKGWWKIEKKGRVDGGTYVHSRFVGKGGRVVCVRTCPVSPENLFHKFRYIIACAKKIPQSVCN